MENSTELFNIALGLSSPWLVTCVTFNSTLSQLDITVGFKKGYKFLMPDEESYTAYDTVERTWQHLDFFQHKCFLHCKVPRVKQKDGKISTQQVPWSRPGSGFTLLFEAYSMLLIESEMPVKKVAKVLNVTDNRLWRVFGFWVNKAHSQDTIKKLERIGFDETSSKKGHNYVTTMVDLDQRRVLFASEGKNAQCIENSVEYLKTKDINVNKIKQACIDMSPAFISGINRHLPNTEITFDKFHVVKELNKAMDTLRKQERRGNEMLKKHKYTFLKSKLTPEIKSEKDLLLEMYPKLAEGYRLKIMFQEFWDISNKEEAESYLAFWCDMAQDSGIFSFIKFVKTLKSHWTGIINYIESKISNGILEGINSKIQLVKRRARGYRNIQNFINMIYFTSAKLKFDYPLYSG